MAYRIRCINVDESGAITHVGGIMNGDQRWSQTAEKTIAEIQEGQEFYFISDKSQERIRVDVYVDEHGAAHLVADQPQKLLGLNRCPPIVEATK